MGAKNLKVEFLHSGHCFGPNIQANQLARIVVSDSPGLVDFAIEQVNSVLNLPYGQVNFILEIQINEEL